MFITCYNQHKLGRRLKMQVKGLMKNYKLILCFILTFLLFMSFSASALEYTIDNDDAQGYSNTRYGYDTYMQYSYLYLGDARRQETGHELTYYRWVYPTYTKAGKMNVQVSVYLNHNDFTDPQASYAVHCHDGFHQIGFLNQRTAPGGWSVFPTKVFTSNQHETDYLSLQSPSERGYNTGADGVIIKFS